jgi:hypothetical protein
MLVYQQKPNLCQEIIVKLGNPFYKTALSVSVWILVPLSTLSQNDDLSLKHGTYVLETSKCKEPAFAAVISWDGVGFSGPHSARCASRVVSRHGNQYSVNTSCGALGDGSPDRSGYVDAISLTRLSNTRFMISKENEPQGKYRWCGSETDNSKAKP